MAVITPEARAAMEKEKNDRQARDRLIGELLRRVEVLEHKIGELMSLVIDTTGPNDGGAGA